MITDEYKNKLLQNLTKMTLVPVYDYADFSDVVSYEKENIISELETAFPNGYVQQGELQCKNSDNEPNGYSIVYGYYYTQSGQTGYAYRKGYIILFDDNMNKVALITQYDSGTDFAPFVILNVDEKGQLYGIDYMLRNGNYKNRFIMLNNISVKIPNQDYKVVLRQSYYVVDEDLWFENYHVMKYIVKDPNSSRYAFGNYADNLMELHIEVGSTNEWIKYEATTYPYENFNELTLTNPKIVWDEEGNLSYWAFFIAHHNEQYDYGIYKATNTGTTINISNELYSVDYLFEDREEFKPNFSTSTNIQYRPYCIYTINENRAYIMIGGTHYVDNQLKALYQVSLIYERGVDRYSFEDWNEDADQRDIPMYCNLEYINGMMFIKYYWQPITTGGGNNYIVNVFAIGSNEPVDSKKTIAEVEPSQIDKFHIFGIKNAFELYTIYWLGQDYDSSLMMLNKTNLVYGAGHYNGEPGMGGFSLVPVQMRLYDDEGIIFARTLYNMTINNNIIESTIQVPNTMLNETTIIGEQLRGYDMTEISNNSEEIEKNIYETLYVNVFNKINMINKNDPDNPINNIVGASRLANSVSTRLEENPDTYANSKIAKVRINYKNGNSYIKGIISCNITNNISDIQFQITIVSDILNIELISNDEATTYQRIVDVEDYELGKTYLISQKCHVE